MICNTISNSDSPIWLKSSTISNSNTFQEIFGTQTIQKFSNDLISDNVYGSRVLFAYFNIKFIGFNDVAELDQLKNKNFIWRKYMLTNPVIITRQNSIQGAENFESIKYEKIIFGQNLLNKLEQNNKIYVNKDICIFNIIN
jgi:hypothetical protein